MQASEVCQYIDRAMAAANISRRTSRDQPSERWSPFRISPEPFLIDRQTDEQLKRLGPHLRDFYHAKDQLYRLSVAKEAPAFLAQHLDAGKPDWLIAVARSNGFLGQIPLVIRPDLLLTDAGLSATELDAIPGSMGLLAFLQQIYGQLGHTLSGERPAGDSFLQALQSLPGEEGLTAIVISEECGGYQLETAWLALQWQKHVANAPVVVRPEELAYQASGVSLAGKRVSRVYRFFELFDWENVPGAPQLFRLAAAGKVVLTPPPKHYLEEKMWFAFLHDPELAVYWQQLLSDEALLALRQLIPPTWLVARDRPSPLGTWQRLATATRRERPFVLKPSGFSALAWGGHGFSRGKDYTTKHWGETIAQLLAKSAIAPFTLQRYLHSLPRPVDFYDFARQEMQQFSGKTRLCPYYFLQLQQQSWHKKEDVVASGALATTVPIEKPVIHGMTEAVMTPAAVSLT